MRALDDKVKSSGEKLDTVASNQAAVMNQQSQLRISQSAMENEIKDMKENLSQSKYPSNEELTELINTIDAVFCTYFFYTG